MEYKEYRTVDKSEWGEGPWLSEPDKVQWQDEATGFPCLIVRNSLGSLCGYVGLLEGHPDFAKDYNIDVDVHGGITFANFCDPGGDETHNICHKPALGESDHVWWLGFDCGHAGDISPVMEATYRKLGGGVDWRSTYTYKALEYVKAEVIRLAQQLKKRSCYEAP